MNDRLRRLRKLRSKIDRKAHPDFYRLVGERIVELEVGPDDSKVIYQAGASPILLGGSTGKRRARLPTEADDWAAQNGGQRGRT